MINFDYEQVEMADTAAPPTEAPADGQPPAEAAAPEAPPKPTGPAYWKFPPVQKQKLTMLDIDDETTLSRDQLKILREAFKIFDSEGKGAIQLEMVKEILTLLGHDIDDEELEEVMDEFDEDESGEIEFPEFVKLAEEFVEPEVDFNTMKKELREVFMMYDKEQRGYIPVADFVSILKELEPELPDDEATAIVKELDSDASGTIEFEEFMEAMIGEED